MLKKKNRVKMSEEQTTKNELEAFRRKTLRVKVELKGNIKNEKRKPPGK